MYNINPSIYNNNCDQTLRQVLSSRDLLFLPEADISLVRNSSLT